MFLVCPPLVHRLHRDAIFLYYIFLLLLLLFADASRFSSEKKANRVVLLDTLSSTTELQWITYTALGNKELGWLEETYTQQSFGNQRAYVSCNVEREFSDNWLFTPRIERQDANRMHINVTYLLRNCSRPSGKSCKETFKLYGAQVGNGVNAPPATDSSKWNLIDIIAANPLTSRDSMSDSSMSYIIKSYAVSDDAVYFALREEGACISIMNVEVYYEVCPEVVKSFTHFPRTVSGEESDSIISVSGECVPHAIPTADTKREPTYVCKGTGKWEMPLGECECGSGYAASLHHNVCIACEVGKYKEKPGNVGCRACPSHSKSVDPGSSECECNYGYYRGADEGSDVGCTQPPSKPTNIKQSSSLESSAVIEWGEPASLGGRKELWYQAKCTSCPPTVRFSPSSPTFKERRLEVSGLESGGRYGIMIFAENDVSDMARSGPAQYAYLEVLTKPLSPLYIEDLKIDSVQENGVTVSWKHGRSGFGFDQPKVFYEVEERHNDSPTVSRTPLLYHTIQNLNPQYRYSFKVRIDRGGEHGPWSNPIFYQVGYGQRIENSDIGFSGTTAIVSSDLFWSGGFPVISLILLACMLILCVAFIFIIRLHRSKGNRKHFSDCDGLDSYKNGTLTPDYNTPPPPGIMQSFFRGKLGAPLIQYGSNHSSACYGNNRFKPYVDPTAYEDPNQALLEFANDVDPNLIRITEVIGSGEFGEVCKGILQPNLRMGAYDMLQAKTIAIKTLKPGSSEKAKGDFLMEASIMGQFEHENVIQLIGVVTKSEPVMIVTEYMENGSLDQFLRKHDDGLIRITQILDLLRGISAGMKYLTEKGFVHRDLAARNVLVDAQLNCKIADFGLSRGLEGSIEQEYTTNGGKIPVRWTAPEAITHRKFTAASDVWSFGVVMWEVCSFGERPYWEWTNQKVISEITLGYRLPAPMDTPTSLHALMLRCWNIDRHRRPTFAQILQVLEEYCRHPDLVYVDSGALESTMSAPFSSPNMSLPTMAGDLRIPSPPASMPPPVPLDEFLKRAGLGHCSAKLHIAGVQSVSDLMRLSQIDLLSYGLIAEEAQRLHRLIAVMQRTLPRQLEQRAHYSPNTQSAKALAQCRIANVPQVVTSTTAGKCDGFFV